jgi:hypothetical protein
MCRRLKTLAQTAFYNSYCCLSLPYQMFMEERLARRIIFNSPFSLISKYGFEDITTSLSSATKAFFQDLDSTISSDYSFKTNTYRVYDVHAIHNIPSTVLLEITNYVASYLGTDRFFLQQTQYQVTHPSLDSKIKDAGQLSLSSNSTRTAPPGYGFHVDDFAPSVKVFFFFGKVTPENGPLQIIPKTHLDKKPFLRRLWFALSKKSKFCYFDSPPGSQLAYKYVTKSDFSALICDMRSLHSSSIPIRGQRRVLVLNYHLNWQYPPFTRFKRTSIQNQ